MTRNSPTSASLPSISSTTKKTPPQACNWLAAAVDVAVAADVVASGDAVASADAVVVAAAAAVVAEAADAVSDVALE
jgi:hypothetical protein